MDTQTTALEKLPDSSVYGYIENKIVMLDIDKLEWEEKLYRYGEFPTGFI